MDINSIDFNELWKGQKAEQPTTKDLLFKLNNFKKKNRNRIIISNVILILTSLFILLIWYQFAYFVRLDLNAFVWILKICEHFTGL